MSKKVDFLQPKTDEIRHQIRGILDSYTHDWDLLSELAQNCVDAIREANPEKGHIELSIDGAAKRITISDNGVGVDPADIERLLRPFGSGKTGKPNLVGEKGVGLKFVIFSSSSFSLRSNGAKGTCTAMIEQASAWVESSGDSPLILDLAEEKSDSEVGTSVEVSVSEKSQRIFDYSFEEILFLLRTKTALGDAGYIWDTPLNADVKLYHTDKGGNKNSKTFECRYLIPTEATKKTDTEDLDAFKTWVLEQDRSDQDKRKKLLNKIVSTKGKKQKAGREIRYWSCFVPRREYWRKLSQGVGISLPEEGAATLAEELKTVGFSGGFETSTKGMPTGISIELKPLGSAGYVPNFFILIDDPLLNFDIGRKSVHGRLQGTLKEIAYETFREFINTTRKYMGGDIDPETGQWDRDEVFSEVEGLPDLGSEATRFGKRPNGQEATVAAIFFEMIGRGKFPEVTPLISGYRDRYDLYAKWKNRRLVLEFKYDLAGLFADFNDERKMFNEINVVVVWEVTEADLIQAKRRGMGVEPIHESSLVEYAGFPMASRRLTLGDVTSIYVVELKSLVDSKA
jgi:anti-sigma regulatory factor (Ser/Thr protein kinase)